MPKLRSTRSDVPLMGFIPDDLSPARRSRRAGLFSSLTASRSSRPLVAHRLPNEGCLSLRNCQYWHFVEQSASSPDDRQHTMAQSAEDTIYISMCSGAMVKISPAEQGDELATPHRVTAISEGPYVMRHSATTLLRSDTHLERAAFNGGPHHRFAARPARRIASALRIDSASNNLRKAAPVR